jgi:hypothetical protein
MTRSNQFLNAGGLLNFSKDAVHCPKSGEKFTFYGQKHGSFHCKSCVEKFEEEIPGYKLDNSLLELIPTQTLWTE